jgi:RNA polymerase sigma factor (sigma-70 family)
MTRTATAPSATDPVFAAGEREMPIGLVAAAYAAYSEPLRHRLTAMTRDASTAEDLVQDAFVRLSLEVQAGRGPDNVGAWLHRVAANLVNSRGRRLSVANRKLASLPLPGSAPSPETVTIQDEQNEALRLALGELTPTDREALLLAAHGYRGPEIARIIGRSEGATRTLLCRARARMRSRLTAAGVGP